MKIFRIALLCGFMYITRPQTSKITSQIMLCFIVIFFTPCYYVIMGLLTIDRFLVFYLNIRYKIYITSTKLIKLTMDTVMTFFTTAIIFSVLIVTQKVTMQWLNNKILPIYIYIYIYIFIVHRQQSRIRKNNHYIRSKDHFKLLIPSLIIFTFTAFKIIPDLLPGAALYGVLQMKALYNIVSHRLCFI